MSKIKFIFISLLLIACPIIAVADEDVSGQALKSLSDKVSELTLSNGVKVIMYRRGIAPTFSGVVAVRVGGSDEKPGGTGISHMFEHMAFKGTSTIGTKNYEREKVLLARLEQLVSDAKGTQNFNAQELKEWQEINNELVKEVWSTETFTREYEKNGASGMNATTDAELTRYFVSLPRTAFQFWCAMEAARLIDPVIRQFYQERDVVMEERRMRNDNSPSGKLYEALLDKAFKVHPYRYPVIGYEKDVNSLTATEVADFHKRYYVASNIVVSLVGDINPDTDIDILERYFGQVPNGTVPPRPDAIEPPQNSQQDFEIKSEAEPLAYLAYHKPIYPHPDDAAISVLSQILAGGKLSPLYTELVKKKQIVTEVGVEEAPGNAYPNLLVVALTPRAPHTNKEAIAAYDSVIAGVKKSGVTDQQLKIAKRALATDQLGKLKSNLSLAIDLASVQQIHGNWRSMFQWYDDVMKVTKEDVNRVLLKYLTHENRTIGRIENSKGSK